MINEIITFLVAALPLSELRGAIPLAIFQFSFSPAKAFILSVLGSIFPVIFILIFMDWFSRFLMTRFDLLKNFLNQLFEYTRNKHLKNFNYWGNLAILIIAAVPLPVAGGAWTASLVAFVFGINKKHAFISISIGTIIAGLIVTIIIISGENLLRFILKY